MAYRLSAGSKSPAIQIRDIFIEELVSASGRLIDTSNDDRDSRIHQARKGIKKARAILRLVQEQLARDSFRRSNKQLRGVAQSISKLRDAQVVLETFDSISQDVEIRKLLEADKVALEQDDLGETMHWAQQKLDAQQQALDGLELEGNGLEPFESGVVEFYRQGRKAMAHARTHPTAVRLHDWRKRVKDHWYHMRLLPAAKTGALTSREVDLRRLETLLGDAHNLHVLRGVLKPVTQAASLLPAVAAQEAELHAQAFVLGEQLYKMRPRAFRLVLRGVLKQESIPRRVIRRKPGAAGLQVIA